MRTKFRKRALLSLLVLVALFMGVAGAFAQPTYTYTDYNNSYTVVPCNLTLEGTLDWLQCGAPNIGTLTSAATTTIYHKAPGTSPLITIALTPTTPNATTGWFPTSWTDGASPYGASYNQSNKFQSLTQIVYTVPVDPSGGVRVLKIWARNSSGTSGLTAQVGAGVPVVFYTASGPAPFTNGGSNGGFYGLIRIYYSSATPTDVMTVTMTGGGLQAAGVALSGETAPAFVSNPLAMPAATVAVPYAQTLANLATSSAGGALTYSKLSGPAWLTIAANGAMTGTPAAGDVGTNVAYTIQATDAVSGLSGTASMTITVNAAGGNVTKIAFVRDRFAGGYNLAAYKAFLENTVYPGRTMVYYDTPGRYINTNWDANKAELLDSDLIIFTNDLTVAYYDWEQWNQLNVPIMMHNQALTNNSNNQLGWTNGNSTYLLRYGPNGYVNQPGNLGWMIMYGTVTGTAGVPRYYTPNTIDPFFANIPATPYAYGDNIANPSHNGPQFGSAGCNLGTTANGDTLVAGQWFQNAVWFQLYAGAKVVGATSNYDVGQGRILGLPMDAADPESNNWYNKGEGYNPSIVRWNQGDQLYRWSVPAPSRRIIFPSGSNIMVDEMTTMFDDPDGAALTPLGQQLLTNALLGLYNPANGRRPVVSAGAATNVYFSGVETSHQYTIADASYSNGGDGAATGTYSWTVTAAVPSNQGSVSITANGTTLSPTITFTKPGIYTATLKAVKSANLDAVYSSKVMTVVASAPVISKTWPSSGMAIETLTGLPTVITFNQPVAVPGMTLTVNGSAALALTDSGDHMNFTCDAITLGATLPATANTAVPFSLNTSGVTSLANGTAFVGATYTWKAVFNATAHAAARIHVFNGGSTTSAYTTPVNAILMSTFGPYTQITWDTPAVYTVPGGLPQATWDAFENSNLIIAGPGIGNNALNAANGWAGGTGYDSAAGLKTPIVMGRYNIWTWDAWASNTSSQWCTEEYRQFPWDATTPTAPMWAGLVLPSHVATIPLETANTAWLQYPNVGNFDEMQSNTTAAPNSGTGLEMADVNSYNTGRTAQYWPAGVALWPASTVVHQGRRGFWGMGPFNYWAYLNADGVTATQNFLKMMAPIPGSPNVVTTNPGAVVAGKLLAPAITFDHSVTSPGSLTITGIGVYSSPVASNENRTWTYTIPIGDWIGKGSQTLNLSIDTSTVVETESGNSYPFLSSTYAWTSTYNVANLTSIVFCTNKANGLPNPYTTYLQSVYPGAAITIVPQATYKANPWSATTLNMMQSASLVIMDGNDAAGTFANSQWNLLATPILSFSDCFYRDPGIGGESASASQYQYQGGAYNVNDTDPLLFKGTTIGYDGSFIFTSYTGNMDLMEFGTAAAPSMNGYTFMIHDTSDPHRPEVQYWPASTVYWTGGTSFASGRRMYVGIDSSYGGDSAIALSQITLNGLQLVKNSLLWMAAPVGQPVIASTTPGATALQAIKTVTLTFDRHVSTPGMLTIKDGTLATITTVATPTAGIEGGIRWIYTLPAGAMLGKTAQTLTFSVDTSTVKEVESGLLLPFATPTATWTSVYNPGNLENVVFVTNQSVGQTVYSTFIQSVYGPNTTVNMMPMSAIQTSKWQPWTAQVMQTANIVIVDSSNTMNGSGIENGLSNNQWNALTNPLIAMTRPGPRSAGWLWATADNNWNTNGMTVKPPQDPLLFNNVNVVNLFVTTNTNSPAIGKLEYAPNTAPTYQGTDYGYYRAGNESDVMLHYWPTGTPFYVGATVSAAGPRMYFSANAGDNDGISRFATNQTTVDGVTLFGNVLRFMSYPAGVPTIVSVSPTAGTLFTTSVPSIITVTFDRPVAGATNITINGAVVGSPVGSVDNTVWTWTVPPASIPNIPTTVNVALTKTGIYESGSGLQLPLGTGTYNWTFSFDKSQFHPTIAFVSNTDTSDDHSAYASFLVNDVFSTSLYTRTIAIEDVRGKYYNMSPGTQSTAQALLNLMIVLPFQTEGQLATKTQWNNLTLPVLVHKAGTAVDWGLGNQPGNFGQWDTWDPITWFGLGAAWPAGQGVANMWPPPASNDPIINTSLHWVNNTVWYWGTTGPFQGIAIPNGTPGVLSTTTPATYTTWGWIGNTVQMVGMWEKGSAFNGGGTAPARRVFQSMGPQVAGDNFGSTEVANFFANDANPSPVFTGGAPQVLRNALRWMLNPDSFPFPLSVKSTGPAMGGNSGLINAPITVVFSKPVSGVLPTDLTWNASSSALTYIATAATPQGSVPTDTWVFDGAWEGNVSLIGLFQPVNMTLNGLDSSYHSHIMSPDGDGCPLTTWTWYYTWTPVPASVSDKVWTLYE